MATIDLANAGSSESSDDEMLRFSPFASSNSKPSKPSNSAVASGKKTAKRPAAVVTVKRKAPKKRKKSELPHCLLWVCTHGKGRSRNWTHSALKVVGVYNSKAAAEQAKRDVMAQHDCCGHGDILVGGCWDDEIDLVIREAPLFMEAGEV